MKSIKLTNIKVNQLAEIFQSLDVKIAYVNKKYEEVSVPAKCRDFLGDVIVSKKVKEPMEIYGFKYDYKEKPFDDCRFSLKFPDNYSKENFIKNLPYLHEKEVQAKVKKSVIISTQHDNTLVIEGSNYWVSSVWKVSLYTLYLKVMGYPSPDKLEQPESSYIKHLTPEIETKMLSKVKMKKEFYPQNTYHCHYDMGFVSVIKGKTSDVPETVMNHNLIFGAA